MDLDDKALALRLTETGNKILRPPDSRDELLNLLEYSELVLTKVKQRPSELVQRALLPVMAALIEHSVIRNSDPDIKITVAVCLSEITRITTPDVPYNDKRMTEVFDLIVASLDNLSLISGRSYDKAASILATIANVRSCVIMLDLECEELLLNMFEKFLKNIRHNHPNSVFLAMKTVMGIIINESDAISVELLKVLLDYVKEDEEAPSMSQKLAVTVVENWAQKLKPFLQKAVKSGKVNGDACSPIFGSMFPGGSDSVEVNCFNDFAEKEAKEPAASAISPEEAVQSGDAAAKLVQSYKSKKINHYASGTQSCLKVDHSKQIKSPMNANSIDHGTQARCASRKKERGPKSRVPDEGNSASLKEPPVSPISPVEALESGDAAAFKSLISCESEKIKCDVSGTEKSRDPDGGNSASLKEPSVSAISPVEALRSGDAAAAQSLLSFKSKKIKCDVSRTEKSSKASEHSRQVKPHMNAHSEAQVVENEGSASRKMGRRHKSRDPDGGNLVSSKEPSASTISLVDALQSSDAAAAKSLLSCKSEKIKCDVSGTEKSSKASDHSRKIKPHMNAHSEVETLVENEERRASHKKGRIPKSRDPDEGNSAFLKEPSASAISPVEALKSGDAGAAKSLLICKSEKMKCDVSGTEKSLKASDHSWHIEPRINAHPEAETIVESEGKSASHKRGRKYKSRDPDGGNSASAISPVEALQSGDAAAAAAMSLLSCKSEKKNHGLSGTEKPLKASDDSRQIKPPMNSHSETETKVKNEARCAFRTRGRKLKFRDPDGGSSASAISAVEALQSAAAAKSLLSCKSEEINHGVSGTEKSLKASDHSRQIKPPKNAHSEAETKHKSEAKCAPRKKLGRPRKDATKHSGNKEIETPFGRKRYKEDIVGCRIQVWWPKDKAYYAGRVTSYEFSSKKHQVNYDDGDLEILNLVKEKFEFIADKDDDEDLRKQLISGGEDDAACCCTD